MQKSSSQQSPLKLKVAIGLAYVLVSSYLIFGLGINWWLVNVWDLNLKFATNALTVSSLQLLVLGVFLRFTSNNENTNPQSGVKHFLLIWLCLFVAYFVATTLTSVYLFQQIDLRYTRYFQLMAVPLLQSLVMIWVIYPEPIRLPADALQQIISHWGIVSLSLLQAGLLTVGIMLPHHEYLGVLGSQSILPAWAGLQLAAAAIFILGNLRSKTFRISGRVWMLVFSFMALAISVNIVFPWIDKIPLIGSSSTLMLLQAKFMPLVIFIAALLILVKTGQLLRLQCKGSGLLFDIAIIVLFLVANVFFLDLYQPYSTPFALTVATVGISIACTCTLSGILLHTTLSARS